MVWHQFANQLIGLIDFNIQNPLIIETFPLYHLPVMYPYSKQNSIHDLSNDKLNNLILKLLSKKNDDHDPGNHINRVSDDKVAKHHIPHEEDQTQGELDL